MINLEKVVKFSDSSFEIDARVDKDSVWLTQDDIALLFDRDRTVINRHIKNIYQDKELNEKETCVKYAQVKKEGNRWVNRNINFYNLDVIISIGYRVNSKKGFVFRNWALNIIKNYLLDGYVINDERVKKLGNTIDIQNRLIELTNNNEDKQLLSVIDRFTDALDLLDFYDHQTLSKPKGNKTTYYLDYKDAREIIDLLKFNGSSSVFGVEKENGKLDGILKAINQNVFGKELYPSLEEKAAHLLYFLVKDHPFVDGCKRIAAALFIEFLNRNNALIKNYKFIIDNNSLASLTILTAESKPEEKEIIINLIMNMLIK